MLDEQKLKYAYEMYVKVCKQDGNLFVTYEKYKDAVEENYKKQFQSYK